MHRLRLCLLYNCSPGLAVVILAVIEFLASVGLQRDHGATSNDVMSLDKVDMMEDD